MSCSHGINALSFSHDGEFIAIANQGNYIDIVSGIALFVTARNNSGYSVR